MHSTKTFALSIIIVLAAACKHDEAPPDLEAITEDVCSVIEMCDVSALNVVFGGTFEGCKADILMDFEEAEDIGDTCFDAMVAYRSCEGAYKSCEEYDMGTINCANKYNNYVNNCRGGL